MRATTCDLDNYTVIGHRRPAGRGRDPHSGGTARHTHPATAPTEGTSGTEEPQKGHEVVSTAPCDGPQTLTAPPGPPMPAHGPHMGAAAG